MRWRLCQFLRRGICVAAALLIGACAAPRIPADSAQPSAQLNAPAEARIAASEVQRFHSERTGARYLVTVALPVAPAAKPVPVVYVIGAPESFPLVAESARVLVRGGEVPPTLVIGVQREDDAWTDAERLLDFLADELQPFVASRYKVDADDATLVGDREGASFALYVLFASPKTFRAYIIDPGPWPDREQTFQREAEYASRASDLPAQVFLAAGGLDPNAANVEELTRRLHERAYPGLTLETVIFHGETRYSAVPATFSRGLRFVYRER
jgi:predicted alpha/beta superfamily hydrolase